MSTLKDLQSSLILPEILAVESMMSRFIMVRHNDVSGASGTGIVTWGVEYPDGRVSSRWALSDWGRQTSSWDDIRDILKTHGHNGATELIWIDNGWG